MEHTFAICAYKESEYLSECIESLLAQTEKSLIFIATSTDNEYIRNIAKQYDIPICVNPGEGGITQDWNFALGRATTKYVTIAHQDDIYEPEYTEKIMKAIKKCKKPIIAFSDYCELRNGKKVRNTKMLKIKRLMLFPLRIKAFWSSKFVRRRVLSLGDPICCPAVTFNMENVEKPIFNNHFLCAEDWEAWEKLSKKSGEFIYLKRPLMCHRIHEESTTTEALKAGVRIDENFEMYCKFWPKSVAKFINKYYTASEKSNDLSKE